MTNSATDIRVDAIVYILHGLLQRMEYLQPGLVSSMIQGAELEKKSMPEVISDRDRIDGIFSEALRILSLAQNQIEFSKRSIN